MSGSQVNRFRVTDRTEPRPSKRTGQNWIRDAIANMDGEFFTITQVSEMTGIPLPTLRKWYRHKDYNMKAPSKQLVAGKTTIYLYTPEDVEEVTAFRNGVRNND